MKKFDWKRNIIRSSIIFVMLYAATCVYMWATQAERIFKPQTVFQTTPARMGMRYEELYIPVGSGADQGELYGWWVPAERQLQSVTNKAASLSTIRTNHIRQAAGYGADSLELFPRRVSASEGSTLRQEGAASDAPTFLYLHGNDYNLANHLEQTLRLHDLGYNVLLVDYRGYGKSSGGAPSETKMYEDAEAAWQYLLKVRGVKPQQAFIYGHSLGGAIAIDLAIRHPEAAGLVTEGTFTSMVDMGKLDYGYLPVDWLVNQRFESLEKISRLKMPVLFIHGTWDNLIPYQMAQQLYDAAPQPKKLMLIKGGQHNNAGTIGWVEFRDTVAAFVKHYAH